MSITTLPDRFKKNCPYCGERTIIPSAIAHTDGLEEYLTAVSSIRSEDDLVGAAPFWADDKTQHCSHCNVLVRIFLDIDCNAHVQELEDAKEELDENGDA